MNEAETRPTDFIRQIIDENLASGKHHRYIHVSHLNRMAIYTLVMQNQFA